MTKTAASRGFIQTTDYICNYEVGMEIPRGHRKGALSGVERRSQVGVNERKINPCRARSDPGPVSCREPVGSGTLDALPCGSKAPW